MSLETEVRGSMEGSVRNAKATFAKIDPILLGKFIQSQDGVRGEVVLGDLVYPSDGAGSSNGIAFFTARLDRGDGPETLELVLRYSPGVQLLKQKSYEAEFKTLRALEGTGLPAPKVLWLDADGSRMGRVGYVMNRVRGDTPSAAMYSKGPLANVSPGARNEMMLKAAGFHGRLRKIALGAEKLPHLHRQVQAGTAIDAELEWWFREVLLVWPQADAKVELIRSLKEWLGRHQPRDLYPAGLVHGDAQIANIIYRDGEIAAVVDWELSYLGHNEADLALIVFLTETQKVTDMMVEGTPSEAEYIARFQEKSGFAVQHWPYFKLLNMYRVVSVSSLSASFMPSFDAVWRFFLGQLMPIWDDAKRVYGA
jgi:aminoglycoside phosphotransferase (APT) family kinase protein